MTRFFVGQKGFVDRLAEDVAAAEVDGLAGAVGDLAAEGHVEDAVELLERLLLGLGDEEEDEEEADDVPAGVPAEGALRREGDQHSGPRQRQDEVEEPGRGRRERHADRPDVQRVGLGRVGEGHRPLAGRVDHAEEVGTQGDAGDVGLALRRDPEGVTGEEHEEGHEREGGQEEVAAAESVDGVEGGDGEEPVDDAEAERGGESCDVTVAGLDEDFGREVGNDVDCLFFV